MGIYFKGEILTVKLVVGVMETLSLMVVVPRPPRLTELFGKGSSAGGREYSM